MFNRLRSTKKSQSSRSPSSWREKERSIILEMVVSITLVTGQILGLLLIPFSRLHIINSNTKLWLHISIIICRIVLLFIQTAAICQINFLLSQHHSLSNPKWTWHILRQGNPSMLPISCKRWMVFILHFACLPLKGVKKNYIIFKDQVHQMYMKTLLRVLVWMIFHLKQLYCTSFSL